MGFLVPGTNAPSAKYASKVRSFDFQGGGLMEAQEAGDGKVGIEMGRGRESIRSGVEQDRQLPWGSIPVKLIVLSLAGQIANAIHTSVVPNGSKLIKSGVVGGNAIMEMKMVRFTKMLHKLCVYIYMHIAFWCGVVWCPWHRRL